MTETPQPTALAFNSSSKYDGVAAASFAKSLAKKYTYERGGNAGSGQTTDCTGLMMYVFKETNPALYNALSKASVRSSGSVRDFAKKHGGIRSAGEINVQKGDIILFPGHVEIVIDVNKDGVMSIIGATGGAKTPVVKPGIPGIKSKEMKVQTGHSIIYGVWTPQF